MLITDIFTVFHQGKELANAATWKNRTVAANTVFAVLSSAFGIAVAVGYKINVDPATLQALAGGIAAAVAVVNSLMHVVTNSEVGLQAKPDSGISQGAEPRG